MKGRTPTAEESAWMSAIVEVGCAVCMMCGLGATPAEVHHIDGKTKPGCHLNTIPLCIRHHRIRDDKRRRWVSRHGDGKKAFQREYGTEEEIRMWVFIRISESQSHATGVGSFTEF